MNFSSLESLRNVVTYGLVFTFLLRIDVVTMIFVCISLVFQNFDSSNENLEAMLASFD